MLIHVKRLSPPTDFEGNQPASSTIFFVTINQKKNVMALLICKNIQLVVQVQYICKPFNPLILYENKMVQINMFLHQNLA